MERKMNFVCTTPTLLPLAGCNTGHSIFIELAGARGPKCSLPQRP